MTKLETNIIFTDSNAFISKWVVVDILDTEIYYVVQSDTQTTNRLFKKINKDHTKNFKLGETST
jgi:hypothetical protein